MSIRFNCQKCGGTVQAPDLVAGKQGRCPRCGHVMDIPQPAEERKQIPLAPEEPQAEQGRQDQEILGQLSQEKRLVDDQAATEKPASADRKIESLIVAYAQALADGAIERADQLSGQLVNYGAPAAEAVERMMIEQLPRPELVELPTPVLLEFLQQLRSQL